jgi:pyrroline-5-carboxylate reductase
MSRNQAQSLVSQALIGAGGCRMRAHSHARITCTACAGTLAQQEPLQHVAVLRASVVSPGGTTAAGLAAMERGNVRAVIAT